MHSASMSSRCSETKPLWRIFQMESQKIRIWRELLATIDKIEKKIERVIEATIFLLLNKTEHFILKRNTLKVK